MKYFIFMVAFQHKETKWNVFHLTQNEAEEQRSTNNNREHFLFPNTVLCKKYILIVIFITYEYTVTISEHMHSVLG